MKNWSAVKQFVKRNAILKESGFSDYQSFLKSPIWNQSKARIQKKISQGKTWYDCCFCCGTKENLQLHHLKYSKTNLSGGVGNYLKYVCGKCHETIHLLTKVCPKLSIKTATMIWKRFKETGVVKPSHKHLMNGFKLTVL
jgi:hypothetical protein